MSRAILLSSSGSIPVGGNEWSSDMFSSSLSDVFRSSSGSGEILRRLCGRSMLVECILDSNAGVVGPVQRKKSVGSDIEKIVRNHSAHSKNCSPKFDRTSYT